MTRFVLEPTLKQTLLDRFLRYVQVDTQSDERSTSSPSTEKQKDLARMLVSELCALGCGDAAMDGWGYVTATVPSNLPPDHPAVPVIGLLAHLDTYPGTSGANVKPQVIPGYTGGDIPLPCLKRPIPVADNPNLERCIGHTLITSDGSTLLGADDKAGIAVIMTLVDYLHTHPECLHGAIRIGFTPDEEVGRGTEHFDVAAFGADYAYTVDGSDLGEVEDETFCADTAVVVITGHDVHPGYAKDKMINAVRIASAIVDALPQEALPETTEGRQAYLHPFEVTGSVNRAELKLLVRAFTEEELSEQERRLQDAVNGVQAAFPKASITVAIQPSYRNMRYAIEKDPKVVDFAVEAVIRQGIEPIKRAIRGGTDGARLSYMGLLTPNLFEGAQSYHSVHEWVSLEWMTASVECCLQVLQVWLEASQKA